MARPATPAKADEWHLSTLEFARLWAEQGGAEFPRVFLADVPSLPRVASTDHPDLRRPGLGEEQRNALAAFTRPRNSVTVLGGDDSQEIADRSHHVRMVAAWSGPVYAYLARQSFDAAATGLIAITRHRVSDLMGAIVDYLPAAIGAGRLRYDAAVKFTERWLTDNERVRDVVIDDDTDSAVQAFAPGVRVGLCGTVSVVAGSVTGSHPPTTLTVRWRDVVGDGRYVLVVDRPGYAAGMHGPRLTELLNNAVEVTRRRHDVAVAEREEYGW